jgi:O-antigen/teichoic acid export membrane protein
VLSVSAFGAFALAYTGLLVINSLQLALVTQPHNVLGAARRDEAYARFTAATLIAALLFLAGVVLVLLVAGFAALRVSSDAGDLLVAMVPATVAWQLQELARRILYTEGRLNAAFLNDVVAYGGQLIGIVVLWRADQLDGPNVLFVIAATSSIGAVIGFAQIRGSFTRTFDRSDLAPHWHFGKWLAAGAVGYWISSNVYLYFAAVLLGASASGELKAAQLVLGPLNVVLIFLGTVLPIRLSQTLAFAGEAAFRARLRRMLIFTAPVVALYCLLASIFATPLLELLYGDRYDDAQVLVGLFAVFYFLSYLGGIATSALNAREQTRPVFNAYFVGAASAIVLVWAFTAAWGVEGGAGGMIVSAALTDLTLLGYLRREGIGLPATSSPR